MDFNRKYKFWHRLNAKEIDENIQQALKENINYYESIKMGLPGSHLDKKEFVPDTNILIGSSYLQVLVNNPNHIGVHTNENISEPYFSGTQKLEKDIIKVISEDILEGKFEEIDGYVPSGGTEGNIQALWIYRNYFNEIKKLKSDFSKIRIICSTDTHYSIDKASNILNVGIEKIKVDENSREIKAEDLRVKLNKLKLQGVSNLILVCNMMTTMFGSVDDIDLFFEIIDEFDYFDTLTHIDGAYGGFLYPFTHKNKRITFKNKRINSFTLDAHKMLQAPYGTGIFLIRKGFFKYSLTNSAKYVPGSDCTLIGSRSGANAISIYKILFKYGAYDWRERVNKLVNRAKSVSENLREMGFRYIYYEGSNIITIHKSCINARIVNKFGLVPDNHDNPNWYKIVIMENVNGDKLKLLLNELCN